MGLFKRVSDIISANLNDLIDGFEEPEKMLRQAVREMEAALNSAMDSAAKVIANQKLLSRQLDEHRRQAEQWQARAAQAVRSDDDERARQALRRKNEHEKLTAALEDQRAAAEATAARLRRQVEAMRVKLAEARRKLLTLSARKRAADARRKLARDTSGAIINDAPFHRFDRFSERIEQAEAEADALVELSGGDLDFDAPDLQIETELAELKRAAKS